MAHQILENLGLGIQLWDFPLKQSTALINFEDDEVILLASRWTSVIHQGEVGFVGWHVAVDEILDLQSYICFKGFSNVPPNHTGSYLLQDLRSEHRGCIDCCVLAAFHDGSNIDA